MPKFFVFSLLISLLVTRASAQTSQDSAVSKDSVSLKPAPVAADTTQVLPKKHHVVKKDSSVAAAGDSAKPIVKTTHVVAVPVTRLIDSMPAAKEMFYIRYPRDSLFTCRRVLAANSYFSFFEEPVQAFMEVRRAVSYDGIFYLMVGVLFYFALVKTLFGKYLSNLFYLFFRVSMRQQQIREQVLQSPLPSLLLNILFLVTGGIYAAFLAGYYHVVPKKDFWGSLVNFSIILGVIYLVKFLLLKCVGWIFNVRHASDTYIFIVFLTNKILGIFLLPFLVILSFSNGFVTDSAITLSLVMVLVFFISRFAASYAPVRKEIKLNGFHFFLYLCAFEIAPLLLIYKLLLTYLEKAY